ncbi:MAG TPA: DUF6335 family protein [Thermoanaerobaculia bacterium]|jgi:hypothetical protein|nr:DUF6335 family protein [Thermoanaerobaculia bacterium]
MRGEKRLTFWDPQPVVDEQSVDLMPMPEPDDVDNYGEAIGITYGSDEELRCVEKEQQRDVHRWELNPASSEDYRSRTHARD